MVKANSYSLESDDPTVYKAFEFLRKRCSEVLCKRCKFATASGPFNFKGSTTKGRQTVYTYCEDHVIQLESSGWKVIEVERVEDPLVTS